uniref:Taste receptor type 2 n=1 Tax=Oncorhynchus kisutch TaxID=8019 RepID=A0A8C7HWS1_ONCKI
MVGSSWVTVCYLYRHMKSMKESGSTFSSPRLHSQMRVTITGILQGILYFLCALWIFISFFSINFSMVFNYTFFNTVISLYMFGTTVNLGLRPMMAYNLILIGLCKAYVNMSTSVWLNFFYYTQIVPAQRALFIWVKRNIKIIIYWGLFVDRVLFLFDLASVIYYVTITEGNDNINDTSTNDTVSGSTDGLFYTDLVCFYSKMIYMFFCLCVMVGSSWVTVCYLHRHMKSMKESGSTFSSPRLHSQMRVTITGILQGILYFLCALWIFLNIFSDNYPSSIKFDYNTYYTVISLYMFSTTVNLGIGQSVFRQRAADIWLKAQQAARSLKLCG